MAKRSTPKTLYVACVICGEMQSLTVDAHRIGGATVTLCHKCFRRLASALRAKPSPTWFPPDELEVIGHALLAEADLLTTLAQSRQQFGQMLIDRVRRDAPDQTPEE